MTCTDEVPTFGAQRQGVRVEPAMPGALDAAFDDGSLRDLRY